MSSPPNGVPVHLQHMLPRESHAMPSLYSWELSSNLQPFGAQMLTEEQYLSTEATDALGCARHNCSDQAIVSFSSADS